MVAAVVFAGLGYGGYKVRQAYVAMFEAEDRLQISLRVTDAIIEYTRANPTHAWPGSWDDLLRQPRGQELTDWPGGMERVRAMVRVDFGTTVDKVLGQTPETCTAITLTPGPNYTGIPARWLYGLYDELHEQRGDKSVR
jgi:hypothetical protein